MMWGSLFPEIALTQPIEQLGSLYTEVFNYLDDNHWVDSVAFFPTNDPVIVIEFSWATALSEAQGLLKEVDEHWQNRFSQIDISY